MAMLANIDGNLLGAVTGGFPGGNQLPKQPKETFDPNDDEFSKQLKRRSRPDLQDNMPSFKPDKNTGDEDMVQPEWRFPFPEFQDT